MLCVDIKHGDVLQVGECKIRLQKKSGTGVRLQIDDPTGRAVKRLPPDEAAPGVRLKK